MSNHYNGTEYPHSFTISGMVGAYQPNKDIVIHAASISELKAKLNTPEVIELLKQYKKGLPRYLRKKKHE